MPGDPVRVVFIAGSGRSGSTLLARLLGSADGAFAAGEVRFLWERGLLANDRCSCGETFRRCAVWSGVIGELERTSPVPPARVLSALASRTRIRRLPAVLLGRGGKALTPEVIEHLASVYRAIAEVTGASTVVDSSKLPLYGHLLSEVPGIEVEVVHLVRDARAAAYSWRESGSRHGTIEGETAMDTFTVRKSAVLWALWNALPPLLWRTRYHRVRYEDLVDEPRAVVAELAAALDLGSTDHLFVDERTAELGDLHLLAGNPSRRGPSQVVLTADDAWRSGLGAADGVQVTALAGPVLAAHGYRLTGTASRR